MLRTLIALVALCQLLAAPSLCRRCRLVLLLLLFATYYRALPYPLTQEPADADGNGNRSSTTTGGDLQLCWASGHPGAPAWTHSQPIHPGPALNREPLGPEAHAWSEFDADACNTVESYSGDCEASATPPGISVLCSLCAGSNVDADHSSFMGFAPAAWCCARVHEVCCSCCLSICLPSVFVHMPGPEDIGGNGDGSSTIGSNLQLMRASGGSGFAAWTHSRPIYPGSALIRSPLGPEAPAWPFFVAEARATVEQASRARGHRATPPGFGATCSLCAGSNDHDGHSSTWMGSALPALHQRACVSGGLGHELSHGRSECVSHAFGTPGPFCSTAVLHQAGSRQLGAAAPAAPPRAFNCSVVALPDDLRLGRLVTPTRPLSERSVAGPPPLGGWGPHAPQAWPVWGFCEGPE